MDCPIAGVRVTSKAAANATRNNVRGKLPAQIRSDLPIVELAVCRASLDLIVFSFSSLAFILRAYLPRNILTARSVMKMALRYLSTPPVYFLLFLIRLSIFCANLRRTRITEPTFAVSLSTPLIRPAPRPQRILSTVRRNLVLLVRNRTPWLGRVTATVARAQRPPADRRTGQLSSLHYLLPSPSYTSTSHNMAISAACGDTPRGTVCLSRLSLDLGVDPAPLYT